MAAAVELLCQLAAIDYRAAAKADLELAAGLLDEYQGHFRAVHGERHVDDVLRVRRQGPRGREIALLDPGVYQPSAKLRAGAGERPSDEAQAADAVALVKMLIEQIGLFAGLCQAASEAKRISRSRGESKPARVRGERGEGRRGISG